VQLEAWSRFKKLSVVVSIDRLQPEHDERRKPATYERILKNISGTRVTIHCTITSQIAMRAGYLDEFLCFWSIRPEIVRVWFSLFTPQRGATDVEILTPPQRASVIADLLRLRRRYPLLDMRDSVIREIASPPRSPRECIFARTTETVSADLSTRITPCQFGGDPDCEQCGCIASMGLAAVGHYHVLGPLTAGHLFMASDRLGNADVISIECSRSRMELLDAFRRVRYPNEIGPGVYDIHSPRVPQDREIANLLHKALEVLTPEQLWVNPDCGLKTRGWPEVQQALAKMVGTAAELRESSV
jgi:hypothetical protein